MALKLNAGGDLFVSVFVQSLTTGWVIRTIAFAKLARPFLFVLVPGSVFVFRSFAAEPEGLDFAAGTNWQATLERFRGVHPRLYLNQERLAALREAIKTTHAARWRQVQEEADRLTEFRPPQYRVERGHAGEEQLWQRPIGDALPTLALVYRLTGDSKYLHAAQRWALASCEYPTWGIGKFNCTDLPAGHQLYGLALFYDWCYADLDEATRRTIRETVLKRGGIMFAAMRDGKIYWHRAYLQNHLWVNGCGLATAGLAMWEEAPETIPWLSLCLSKFQRTFEALGSDGASHEGVGYWDYGVEHMIKFNLLSRDMFGVNLFTNSWWPKTASFRQYLSLPRHAWSQSECIVDLGDYARGNAHHPDYTLFALASEFRDGYAQWMGLEMEVAGIGSKPRAWLALLWYDPSVTPRAPDRRPTLQHFADMDIVSARSDWSGDESMVVFKCGPFIGHKGMEMFSEYDPGGGHAHPDANHFVWFAGGEWLLRDEGYTHLKWTGNHNTLLIDGEGQVGEGTKWFNGAAILEAKATARVIRAESSARLDHIVGDATRAYPGRFGLRRYVRHLLFLKPDVVIVADDILLDGPRQLELRFHPEATRTVADGAAFLLKGKTTMLRLEVLTPKDVGVQAESINYGAPEFDDPRQLFTIRLTRKDIAWRNAVAFSWNKGDDKPVKVTVRPDGDLWRFAAGQRQVALDWQTGTARVISDE